MKTRNRKHPFSLILVLLLWAFVAHANQNNLDKTFKWDFEVGDNPTIHLDNYDCDVEITTSDQNMVYFEITVNAEAQSSTDIDKLESCLENRDFSANSNKVVLSTKIWEYRQVEQKGGKGIIFLELTGKNKGNDKTVVLNHFEIKAKLQMPATAQFKLGTKYSDIVLGNVDKLTLESYKDKLFGQNVHSQTSIDAKYSEMEFGAVGKANLTLYDCSFEAKSAMGLVVKSKYSKIEVDTTGDVAVDSYKDKFGFNKTGDINMNAKYTELSGNVAGDLKMDVYKTVVDIPTIGNLNIKTIKYSDYKFGIANNVTINDSYKNNFEFAVLSQIVVDMTKYSNFEIGRLDQNLQIAGYKDNVYIRETTSNLKYVDFENKYGELDINLPENLSFKLDFIVKYGEIKMDKPGFAILEQTNEHSELKCLGIKGTDNGNLSQIKVRGYKIELSINDN